MASSNRAILHQYQLRDQPCDNQPRRKAMMIGVTKDENKSVWMSCDERPPPQGLHPIYYFSEKESTSWAKVTANNNLEFASGLELEQFSSQRATKTHIPQTTCQKALIRRVYIQHGIQYDGDREEVEKAHTEKYAKFKAKRDEKKVRKPMNKEKKRPSKSASKLDLFERDAQNLQNTKANIKKVAALMEDKGWEVPPYKVLHNALQEAHERELNNAYYTAVFLKWTAKSKPSRKQSVETDDDLSESDGSQDGEGLVRARGREMDASNDDMDIGNEEDEEEGLSDKGEGLSDKGEGLSDEEEGPADEEKGHADEQEGHADKGEKDEAMQIGDTAPAQVEQNTLSDNQDPQIEDPVVAQVEQSALNNNQDLRQGISTANGPWYADSRRVNTPLGVLTVPNLTYHRRVLRMLCGEEDW